MQVREFFVIIHFGDNPFATQSIKLKNFWPDTFETKEEFKESIQNMLQNKDTFYDLEDDF